MKSGTAGKVKLTQEDRAAVKEAAQAAGPAEILVLWHFMTDHKEQFTKADWGFICSQLGRRSEKLLRNVAKNFSWED